MTKRSVLQTSILTLLFMLLFAAISLALSVTYTPEVVPPMNLGNSEVFTAIPTDTSGDVVVTWTVNGQLAQQGENNFTYAFTQEVPYTIQVVVSDSLDSTTHTWDVDLSPLPGAPVKEDLCGNTNIDAGETCNNCPQDVVCGEGETCSNGLCQKEESNKRLIIGIVVGIILLIGIILGLYFYTKNRPYEHLDDYKTIMTPLSADTEKKLRRYVEDANNAGMSKQEVTKELLKKGWKPDQIERILK